MSHIGVTRNQFTMEATTTRRLRRRPKSKTLHVRVTPEMWSRLEMKADTEQKDISEIAREGLALLLVAR